MSEPRDRAPHGVAASAWVPPTVRGPVVRARSNGPGDEDTSRFVRDAYAEGFEQGRRDGERLLTQERERLQAEIEERVRRLDSIFASAAAPLAALDERAAHELARLALEAGRHLARRELSVDPTQVIAIIRETVNMLPLAQREVRVAVHPADGAVIRERLARMDGDRAWVLVDDPVMTRGGCRVIADHAHVDARFESRFAAVAAQVLGDDRSDARDPGSSEGAQ